MTAPKVSPFDNFTTSFQNSFTLNYEDYFQSTNEHHIYLHLRNANWLAKEIDDITNNNDTFDCTYMCANTQISGTNLVCSTATYSVPYINGVSYNWTIIEGANLVTFTGNGTTNITVTKVINGKVTLQVTFGNSTCGYLTLTKTIYAGATGMAVLTNNSGYPYSQSNLPEGCTNYDAPYWTFKTSSDIDAVTQFIFTFNNQTITKTAIGGKATITAQELGMVGGQSLAVKVTPKNSCGVNLKNISFTLYKPTSCECGKGTGCNLARVASQDIYIIYPNPSSSIVNIDLLSPNNKPVKGTNISGELFDLMGQSKSKIEIINNKASFSVQGLDKGVYVLKIYINDLVESHQIGVE